MKNTFLIVMLISSLFCNQLFAQDEPVSTNIAVNKVKATVSSNGALFHDFEDGKFIAPFEWGAEAISTIRASGLWLAGIDPGGSLKGSIQTYNENGKKDFIPSPDFNNVWRVTYDDVEAHKADFADNGVVDDPNPNIFGYPGRNNPFFDQYNSGLVLEDETHPLAPFYDNFSNGQYDPDEGDYPIIKIRGCDPDIARPNEMLWFSFEDQVVHTESQMDPMNIKIQCQVFAFNCEEETPLNNTIIVSFKLIYLGEENLDSTYFGIFTDFNIGNGNDDFLGTVPNQSVIYAYNGDETDEGGYESGAPAMAMDILRGPLKVINGDTIVEVGLSHIQSLGDVSTLTGSEFYNLLSGSDVNGVPIPNGGILYPDNPNDPNGNSEVTAGNAPGERKALGSMGPFVLEPGAVNEFIISYTFFKDEGNTPLQNVDGLLGGQIDIIQALFDNCFATQSFCSTTVPAKELVAENEIQLFPNPTSSSLNIKATEKGLKVIKVVNLNGQVVTEYNWSTAQKELTLDITNLSSGVYVLHVVTAKGNIVMKKIAVMK